jgi:hypothetical protein
MGSSSDDSNSNSSSSKEEENEEEVEYLFKKENNLVKKKSKKFEFRKTNNGTFEKDMTILANKLPKGSKHKFSIQIDYIDWQSNSWAFAIGVVQKGKTSMLDYQSRLTLF